MDENNRQDVFDMDVDEFAANLKQVAETVVGQAFEQDLYVSYPAGLPELPNSFVHEYKNGRRLLVQIDTNTGKEHFIKDL